MNSVFKLSCSRLALLAGFGLAASFAPAAFTPASAADLGGNCCADLEERIAELEATTARKGNRKVSLTISGWVNESVFWWDDSHEANAYVGTNSLEQSRFRFVGEAKIADGYSAGYTLEIGTQGDPSNQFNQTSPGPNTTCTSGVNCLLVRKSNWWLKSKDYGKVTVGLEGTATYHLLDDADIANTRNFYDAQADGAYQSAWFLTGAGAHGLKWTDIMRGADNSTPGQSGRRNIVRYDSPAIAGFVVTAAWGEDDVGDVALTYTGQWGDFKMIARGGYAQNTDEGTLTCHTIANPVPAGQREDCEWFGAAGSIMHVPTGLYVYGGFGEMKDHTRAQVAPANLNLVDGTDDIWFIQAGIEQKWHPLGKTTIFGQYRHDDPGSNPTKNDGVAAQFVEGSNLNFWSAGVVQNIDAAAMDLYVMYRHADGDVTYATVGSQSLDSFQEVITGALIKF